MRNPRSSLLLVFVVVSLVVAEQGASVTPEGDEIPQLHRSSLRQNFWRNSWEMSKNLAVTLVEAAALLPARHYDSTSPYSKKQEKGEICLLEPPKRRRDSTTTKAVVRIRQKGGDTLPLAQRDRLQLLEKRLGGSPQYDEEDIETKEGAKLLSVSFGLVSTTLGLVADTVRVSGDTTAGVLGSSVRLLGGTIKTMGNNLYTVDRLLMPPSEEDERGTRNQARPLDRSLPRTKLTTHRLIEQRRRNKQEDNKGRFKQKTGGGVVHNSRKVASRGLRLIGNAVQGLGESLVLVGGATESFTASTFGLAEDSVRILEDVAGILSTSILPKPQKLNGEPEYSESEFHSSKPRVGDSSYLSFGEKQSNETVDETRHGATAGSDSADPNPDDEPSVARCIRVVFYWLESYFEFAFKSSQGVPSMALDLLLVLGISYMCALAALYFPSVRWSVSQESTSRQSRQQMSMKRERSGPITVVSSIASTSVRFIVGLVLLPLRLLWFVIRLAINRKSVLLYIHIGAWMYLSRASQLRSAAIQRHAENEGFRFAIESIGITSPSIEESVVWLNSFLVQIWRVPESSNVTYRQHKYPSFVERAIQWTLSKEEATCKGNETRFCPTSARYGGFEPYLSSSIGNNLILALESAKESRPSDLAYVSVHSFTLGSRPPLIRHVELLGKDEGSGGVAYMIDISALLQDATLILDMKLSNLDFAMIPSTKVSVHSLEVNLPLKVTVDPLPHYPFISRLDISLARLPECNVRITPKSKDSALVGVDLGSLPVIRDFVQGALQRTLSDYVSPKYISIDFPSWLQSSKKSSSRSLPRTDLSNLRRHRAEVSDPIRPTETRRSPLPVALMIKPKTQRSEMALRLWLVQQHETRDDN